MSRMTVVASMCCPSFLLISCILPNPYEQQRLPFPPRTNTESQRLLKCLHTLADVQNRGRKQNNENTGEDKQYKGKEYFDFGFRGHLLGPLPSFQTNLVGKPAQCSDDRRTEPIGLHQHGYKQRELRNLRSLCRAFPCLQP